MSRKLARGQASRAVLDRRRAAICSGGLQRDAGQLHRTESELHRLPGIAESGYWIRSQFAKFDAPG